MNLKKQVKISVILTTRNYARFLNESIESVLKQTFKDFELIIINDGSADHTDEVLASYTNNPRIKILKENGVGLAAACNKAIKNSRGKYIIRLDADDYFDENMLLVESTILDLEDDVNLVYSDYYRIDAAGGIIDYYRLMKSNDELKLLDRAPLGAGAMYRRKCYEEIGGYNEELKFQEDYDFWLKFIQRFKVYNVRIPLMYYRKHDGSMSTNTASRMDCRRRVKHDFVNKNVTLDKNIIGLIRASVFLKKTKPFLKEINNRPLICYSIAALRGCEYIRDVYVMTDDMDVEKAAMSCGAKSIGLHPKNLANAGVSRGEVVNYYLKEFDRYGIALPDVIATMAVNYPLIKSHHITEAIDTLVLHDYDSVISVMEHYDFYWQPGPVGLKPFGYDRKMMKEDSNTLYLETGGIRIVKTANFSGENWLGNSIGFIELSPKEAISLDDGEVSEALISFMMKENDISQNKVLSIE